jgi:hypothetical protein
MRNAVHPNLLHALHHFESRAKTSAKFALFSQPPLYFRRSTSSIFGAIFCIRGNIVQILQFCSKQMFYYLKVYDQMNRIYIIADYWLMNFR